MASSLRFCPVRPKMGIRDAHVAKRFSKVKQVPGAVASFAASGSTAQNKLGRRTSRLEDEIVQIAAKKGLSVQTVLHNLEVIRGLLPDIHSSLKRMKAAEWVQLATNVDQIPSKLLALRRAYPKADAGRILALYPRALLLSADAIESSAHQVKLLLAGCLNPDQVVEGAPWLTDPSTLSIALTQLRSWYPSEDPVELIQKNAHWFVSSDERQTEGTPESSIDYSTDRLQGSWSNI